MWVKGGMAESGPHDLVRIMGRPGDGIRKQIIF